MADLEGCTGDAGQFFEVVQASTAVAEAEELLNFSSLQVAIESL